MFMCACIRIRPPFIILHNGMQNMGYSIIQVTQCDFYLLSFFFIFIHLVLFIRENLKYNSLKIYLIPIF